MAKGDKGGKKDKPSVRKRGGQKKRNKKSNRYGYVYDQRKGTWTARDKAEEEFGRTLTRGLDKERVDAELAVMNHCGKRGPPFLIAPSVIVFLMRLKEFLNKSYRVIAGMVKEQLEPLGIYCPTYSSARKLAERYMGTEEGMKIMEKASELADAVFKEILRYTDLRVPHEIEDAELMTARVVPDSSGGRPRRVAVDGSGQTLMSTGAWKRRKWGGSSGKFAHQHAMVDIDTLEPIAFLTASDKVGDAKVLRILLEAALGGGHNIKKVFGDSSYDTFYNWEAVTGKKIEFVVSLKPNAKKGLDSFERNEEIGIVDTIGRELWATLFGYGRRWLVEVFFSVLKKVFGDSVHAHVFGMIAKCMDVKYSLYYERQKMIRRHLEGLTN